MYLFVLFLISFGVLAEPRHVHQLDNILISSPNRSMSNTALPVSVLTADELAKKSAATIGETLEQESGMFNQSFGPGVGQPVIRGQSGSRVQVLQNSLGSLDVSSISPDHSNSSEALLAERIEVLRGPATLLYGSGAIGGIVNVIDNRIPEKLPEYGFQGAIEQKYNTVNEGKSSVFKLDGKLDSFAWHVDGVYRDSIDLQIPGNAFSHASGGSQNRLSNSHTRAYSGSVGVSYVGDKNMFGIAVNHLDNNYGVPPGEENEVVSIEQRQTRFDLKGAFKQPVSGVEWVRYKLAYNDYQHTEFEGSAAGTQFSNEGLESRMEVIQSPWWVFDHGVIGFQAKNSTFAALGDEAVVPMSDIDSFALFSIQDIHTEHLIYELGLRVEQQWIEAENGASLSHTPFSFSASALWEVTEFDSIKLTFSRSQRAPDIQELLSNGPHHATASFDIGSTTLTEETSHNIELGFHLDRSWLQADINVFYNWVENYIAQVNSGLVYDEDADSIVSTCPVSSDCMTVFNTQQRDAQFTGFEAKLLIPLWHTDEGELHSEWFADYVHGRFSNSEAIPRMPPLRYGSQVAWQAERWSASFRVTRAEDQERAGENENQTQGYWKVDAAADYRLTLQERYQALLFAKAKNLLDEDIRNAVSFLREVSPEAGFGVEFGIRLTF